MAGRDFNYPQLSSWIGRASDFYSLQGAAMTERTSLQVLIDAMAARAVTDYLTQKPAPEQADALERTERVPLPVTDKAA